MEAVERKQLLRKSKVEYLTGRGVVTLNLAQGCSHGCKYPCYAYLMARRFGEVDGYEDWCEPKPVEGVLEQLSRELEDHMFRSTGPMGKAYGTTFRLFRERVTKGDVERALASTMREVEKFQAVGGTVERIDGPEGMVVWRVFVPAKSPGQARARLGTFKHRIRERVVPAGFDVLSPKFCAPVKKVHLSFSTDPFMHGRLDIRELSLQAASLINAHGTPVSVLTKGDLPTPEELDTHGIIHRRNAFGISLASVDEAFREKWEPGAAPYAERIEALRKLSEAGVRTWASLEPFPALAGEDHPYSVLEGVLESIPFVDRIIFGRWNYAVAKPCNVDDERGFYNGAAAFVREWCDARDISCRIKRGTETEEEAA